MAKSVVWSILAKEQKKQILQYWLHRNKSNEYPRKLNTLITDTITLLAEYSYPRIATNIEEVYVKIIRDYKIFFKEDQEAIYILSIYDTRQDPENLSNILK